MGRGERKSGSPSRVRIKLAEEYWPDKKHYNHKVLRYQLGGPFNLHISLLDYMPLANGLSLFMFHWCRIFKAFSLNQKSKKEKGKR
jgi:hypothetical protein